jgi:heterotetrameric sarcosine oxidase delta subunit
VFRIPCPHCGPRNVSEFRHVGERRSRPDPETASLEVWRAYLYEQHNVAGWSAESWYHSFGCRRFISVERHTVTNEVRAVEQHPEAGQAAAGSASADSGAPDAGGTS